VRMHMDSGKCSVTPFACNTLGGGGTCFISGIQQLVDWFSMKTENPMILLDPRGGGTPNEGVTEDI